MSWKEDKYVELSQPAHTYFKKELWFKASFKRKESWAINHVHLDYLEQ